MPKRKRSQSRGALVLQVFCSESSLQDAWWGVFDDSDRLALGLTCKALCMIWVGPHISPGNETLLGWSAGSKKGKRRATSYSTPKDAASMLAACFSYSIPDSLVYERSTLPFVQAVLQSTTVDITDGERLMALLAAIAGDGCRRLYCCGFPITDIGIEGWVNSGKTRHIESIVLGRQRKGLRKLVLKKMTMTNFPRLETLVLADTSQVRGCWMTALSVSCPTLRTLCVSHCPQLAEKGIRVIASKFRKISQLHLSHTKDLSLNDVICTLACNANPELIASLESLVLHSSGACPLNLYGHSLPLHISKNAKAHENVASSTLTRLHATFPNVRVIEKRI